MQQNFVQIQHTHLRCCFLIFACFELAAAVRALFAAVLSAFVRS